MRLLFFSDSHLAERPPASRNPTYAEDVFRKLAEVKEIAATCDISIFGGDLYHAAHPPHAIVRRTIELLRDWPCPLYIVVGNHDLPADGMAGLDRTALGVVLEALKESPRKGGRYPGGARLLDDDVLIKSERDVEDEAIARAGSGTPRGPQDPYIQLSPGHWTPSIDGDASALMMGREISPSWKKVRIKIVHALVMATGKDHPFKCVVADEIETDADILLVAHTHWATSGKTKNGRLVIGPGSITRTQRSERELKRQVGVSVLTITKDQPIAHEFIPLKSMRPAIEVFHAVEEAGETRDERLDGYVATLESGLFLGGDSVEGALALMEGKAPKGVSEKAMEYLRAAGL